MTKRGAAGAVVCCAVLLSAGLAVAHWCSNIFVAHARFVVKPEKTTVYVGSGGTQLRVYVQNNFPYAMHNVALRAVPTSSSYTVSVSPPISTGHKIYPGQNVSYLLDISGPTGNVTTTTLNLQVRFRNIQTSNPSSWAWRDMDHAYVAQNPTESSIKSWSTYSSSQAASLEGAMLADKYPSATYSSSAPFFGRDGLEQLIHWFGYRFCYSSGGSWRCSPPAQSSYLDCPNPCAEGGAWTAIDQFPQHCMRAGVELARRRAKLGTLMPQARDGTVNAMKAGSSQHRCLAGIVGGYLWQGVAAPNAFTTQVSASSMPTACKNAAMRAFNGTSASSCSGLSNYYEEAACAAAEGLNNNDAPVKSILMVKASDGEPPSSSTAVPGYPGLYYAYMLAIVQGYRKAVNGTVPFYPDAGAPTTDAAPPPPDLKVTGDTVPWPDSKPPADTQAPPKDQAVTTPDTKPWPADQAVATPDTSSPTGDQGTTADQQLAGDSTVTDSSQPRDSVSFSETGVPLPDSTSHGQSRSLEGGCGCDVGQRGAASAARVPFLLGLLCLFGYTRRKRK